MPIAEKEAVTLDDTFVFVNFVNWWFFNKFINLIDILFDFNSFNYTVSFYFFLRYHFKRNS